MIERIYLLLEILTLLFVISDLFGKNFKLNFPVVMVITVDVMFYMIVRRIGYYNISIMFPYFLIFIYCLWEYKATIIETAIKIMVAIMFLGVIQLVAGLGGFFIKNDIAFDFVVNIAVSAAVFLLLRKNVFRRIFCYIKQNSKSLFFVLLFCAGLFLVLMCIYKFIKGFSFLEYMLIVTLYFIFGGMVYVWKKENENVIRKRKEIELFYDSREQEGKLYREIRRRQHEFKNQLNAIYSTHYTCRTYEELVDAQQKYADWMKKDYQCTDLFLSCKPTVLRGFLYRQIERAKELGIQLSYSVNIVDIHNADMEYDFICIFGILFDNAVEAVLKQIKKEPQIKIVFNYDGDNEELRIENTGDYIRQEEFIKWFKEGYSEKGDNRGYGLVNMMSLKEKYKAEIVVENVERDGENWIVVSFKI